MDMSLNKLQELVTQRVKNLPAMQETQVWSLGWEDPLETEMATHSSILDWRIPGTEEPAVHGVAESWTQLSNQQFHIHVYDVCMYICYEMQYAYIVMYYWWID